MPDSTLPCVARLAAIELAGRDARAFAQRQFAGDVAALTAPGWQWNSWLDAKGGVRALMQLVAIADDTLFALLRGGNAVSVRDELARFLLRSQLELRVQEFTAHAAGPLAIGAVVRAGDGLALGYGERSLQLRPGRTGDGPADPLATMAWRLADIAAGYPNLPIDGPRFLPPALGLERLGAIAFGKGCYPGQELAARLHYRGGHKRRLCHLRGASPLPIGDLADGDGNWRASVLDVARQGLQHHALAVVPLEATSRINLLDNIYDVVRMFIP